jgi:hypothetical protein
VKRILAYILLFIMAAQVLPLSPFEQEGKAVVVLEKGLEAEENLNEKAAKEDKVAALHSFNFISPATNLTSESTYHSPLILSPVKSVATPPPNIS